MLCGKAPQRLSAKKPSTLPTYGGLPMSFRTRAFHPRRAVIVLASIAIFMCAPALADSLVVPELQVSERIDGVSRCPDGTSLKAAYFCGTHGQSFALVPWDGVNKLMVSTVSASGVRSQSGFL